MDTVRLNITLPKNLAEQLERYAGDRGKSSFISKSIEERCKMIEKYNEIVNCYRIFHVPSRTYVMCGTPVFRDHPPACGLNVKNLY